MFRIGKEFHLLHVVSDLNAVDEWYDRIFSVRRFVRNYMKAAMRKASLVLIGDFVMEPAQPVKSEGWEKSALGKFYGRYGQHFHSVAWYVDDLREASLQLSSRKIRMFDMVGKPVVEATHGDAVWTHPQDTHAAFELAVAPRFFIDPRLRPGWSVEFPRDQHPLGIERASHITVLFRKLDDARAVYEEALGGKLPLNGGERIAVSSGVLHAEGSLLDPFRRCPTRIVTKDLDRDSIESELDSAVVSRRHGVHTFQVGTTIEQL